MGQLETKQIPPSVHARFFNTETGDNCIGVREETVEPEREAMILSSRHNFCEQIRHHLLYDTETHHHITETYIAPDQMVPDL